MSAELGFNPKLGFSSQHTDLHASSSRAITSDNGGGLKEVVLQVFKRLAENGLGTWDTLESVALACGVEDPKAAHLNYLGKRVPPKADYSNARERYHIMAETLLANAHLPLDFTPFLSTFTDYTSVHSADLHVLEWLSKTTCSGSRLAESCEEIISTASETLALSSAEREVFRKTIHEAIRETPYLEALFLPSLLSLSPKDREGIDLTGSKDALMTQLLIAALKKKPPEPFALTTEAKLLTLGCLPDRLALKLNTTLTTAPKDTEAVLADLCRLRSIDLGVEGNARNSWEMYAKDQFKRIKATENESPLSLELANRWSEISSLLPKEMPAAWIQELGAKGWEADSILGRTHIYKHRDTGRFLAIKWQKEKEDPKELFKEQITLEVVRKHQERLGLLSQFPEPVGVFSFEGDLSPGFFDETKVPVRAKDPTKEKVAYIYEFPDDSYFSYLHDPKEHEDKASVSAAYSLARRRMIADLFTLAKNGLIMTQLADLFHRSEAQRSKRDDRGRFLAMNFLVRSKQYCLIPDEEGFTGVGNGRLHHLETAVQYPNAGYSGLRDIGDSQLLKDFANPDLPLNKEHFTALWTEKPHLATTCILANFLAEYLLVYELIITERRTQQEGNQLDWQDPEKVSELAAELKEGFIDAMRYYSGISRAVSKRFVENASIDWLRAARQLHFFSRRDEKGYVPYNTPELMPKEVIDKAVKNAFQTYWNSNGVMFEELETGGDSKVHHRGAYSGTDPVKEPEKGRVILMTHMFLLEEAKERAITLKMQANALLKKASSSAASSSENPGDKILEAERLYQESLEYWPYDKEVYKSLSEVYNTLGNEEKAASCRRQWAALAIQNQWERHLKSR